LHEKLGPLSIGPDLDDTSLGDVREEYTLDERVGNRLLDTQSSASPEARLVVALVPTVGIAALLLTTRIPSETRITATTVDRSSEQVTEFPLATLGGPPLGHEREQLMVLLLGEDGLPHPGVAVGVVLAHPAEPRGVKRL
jgi:hypothetical protein